ncbi:HD domain-containing protein [Olsenella urininfantis]|uniref:HD domain-containing protein n=1 Tax=Olsenella urininfantis TaxID=1871033 RepID=UPI000986FC51|nr:HD domain-containing protein [Olsenella urininfantis]
MPFNIRRLPIPTQVRAHELVRLHCSDILSSAGMEVERRCIQHGTTSVFAHSMAVTMACVALAQALRVAVDERALVRGALLHDYFLYDWHESDPSHRLHGFTHPGRACANAIRDFGIGPVEQHMVRHHMFPLTPIPPRCREAVILCLADKYVATKETMAGLLHKRMPGARKPLAQGGSDDLA